MLRYAITDSKRFGNAFKARHKGLIAQVARLSEEGVDYIQLREKDLNAGELLVLAETFADLLESSGKSVKLLINARADVAIAANAQGVHLTSRRDELMPQQIRELFANTDSGRAVVSVSCHSLLDITTAVANQADLILFGPVFEKRVLAERVAAGVGLGALAAAVAAAGTIPVLALGGVTETNASSCVAIGAAGVASIRMFL